MLKRPLLQRSSSGNSRLAASVRVSFENLGLINVVHVWKHAGCRLWVVRELNPVTPWKMRRRKNRTTLFDTAPRKLQEERGKQDRGDHRDFPSSHAYQEDNKSIVMHPPPASLLPAPLVVTPLTREEKKLSEQVSGLSEVCSGMTTRSLASHVPARGRESSAGLRLDTLRRHRGSRGIASRHCLVTFTFVCKVLRKVKNNTDLNAWQSGHLPFASVRLLHPNGDGSGRQPQGVMAVTSKEGDRGR